MRIASWMALALVLVAAVCPARTVEFPENRGADGLELVRSTDSFVDVSLKLDKVGIEDVVVDGTTMHQITLPGVVLPGDAGAPNLPGFGRFVALPEGALPRLEILSMRTELLTGIDVLPAAPMPFENDDSPPVYKKNDAIYLTDAPYPAEPVRLSDVREMRGVDVSILGVTPFQYNPVTRELTVITDVQIRVTFDGGGGRFGEDRLRSRHWEPILEQHLINYASLPEVDFPKASSRDEEYEYVIVVPDDPTYTAWADSLKRFRTLQGIDTGVVTLTQTGATQAEIEAWVDNAYNTWQTPPAAILMLADYVTNGGTTGITCPSYSYYTYTAVSDNQYSDVDGDHLPDITFARMTATPTTIETLVRKAIDYERFPSTNQDFYDNPVVACGWQTERWFQVCSEVVYGFLANELGKTPVREYNIYLGTPGTSWSSNANTYMLVDYFGPDGLGYLPATPEHLTDWSASAARLNADINAGAFIVQHRDHGSETGWGEPDYGNSDLVGLSNADLTFVFSINCLTGKFNYGGECFTEAFHRVSPRALGLIAASETSMSFVNDAFVFGIYDMLWPEFDPGYPVVRGRDAGSTDLRPGFANASGKYYLQASSWPYNPEDKELTFYLFHMHGDAFTTLYSEMPEQLTVSHQGVLPVGAASFSITADEGSIVALTVDGEIIAVAEGTGSEMSMPVTPVPQPGVAKLTVTKANHYRHVEDVLVIYPVTYDITPTTISINRATGVTVTVWDDLGVEKPDVVVTIDGWGISAHVDTTDVLGEAHFSVLAPYGEDLTVVGRTIGESYDCLSDVLPVVDGVPLPSADIDASVASIGLYGSLTPYYEGLITGTATTSGFTLYATGCGVDKSESSGAGSVVELRVAPTTTGTIHAAIGKSGYDVHLKDVSVDVVYGQLGGEVYEATRAPVEGARVKGYAAGADTSSASPVFSELTDAGGSYAVEDDLDVGYYDVYVLKFGYNPYSEEIFVQYGANDADYYIDFAPSDVVSGYVTETGTGRALEATVRFYRSDNMELYTEVTSDSLAGGYYEATLPYFNYLMNVRAYHHIPESRAISVAGPLSENFVLEPTLANILVIDDMDGAKEDYKVDKTGAVLDIAPVTKDGARSASQISLDLVDLGYDVTEETSAVTNPATWLDYDFIVWSDGDDTSPVSDASYRTNLETYVANGGKLLIEGGETAYDAQSYPGYPSFCTNVLHVLDWVADSSGNLRAYDMGHPVTTFPNTVGTITFTYVGYGDEDSSVPTADAVTVCDWSSQAGNSGVIVYDDNPDPASGQIVFYEFDYTAGDPAGVKALLENTVIYLTALESTPTGGMSGQVCLEGEGDHSGIKVTAYPGGEFGMTDASGYFQIDALYTASYTAQASKDGWSVSRVTGISVVEGQVTGGVTMMLYPVTDAETCVSPYLAIPDSYSVGVYDTLAMTDDLAITDIEVYVNLTHTYIGDLIVEVTSPEGTTVRLHSQSGSGSDDIIGWYDSELTVDGPGALSDFAGESCAGEWQIWVSDNVGADTGTLNTWCVHVYGGASTGISEDELDETPATHVLRGVAPNPFNPVTEVSYGLATRGHVALHVYDVSGRLVRTLVDGQKGAGYHTAVWNGRDDRGVEVASGVYFCRMAAGGFTASTKMVLLK